MKSRPETFEEWLRRFTNELDSFPNYARAWEGLVEAGCIGRALERQLWSVTRVEWQESIAEIRNKRNEQRKQWSTKLAQLSKSLHRVSANLESAMPQLKFLQAQTDENMRRALMQAYVGPPQTSSHDLSETQVPITTAIPEVRPEQLLAVVRAWAGEVDDVVAIVRSDPRRISGASLTHLSVLKLIRLMTKTLKWTEIALVLEAAHSAAGTPEQIDPKALQMLWARNRRSRPR